MNWIAKITVFIILTLTSVLVNAQPFESGASFDVCFTPQQVLPWQQTCTDKVVNAINNAQQAILMQAYSFTASAIAKALIKAKQRGVAVKVILDKSQVQGNQYSVAKFLRNQGIALWVDYSVNIAHNKVIIIDNNTVITGSFNFTKAAQNANAENLLIIKSSLLANAYAQNWQRRMIVSSRYKTARQAYYADQDWNEGADLIKKLLSLFK